MIRSIIFSGFLILACAGAPPICAGGQAAPAKPAPAAAQPAEVVKVGEIKFEGLKSRTPEQVIQSLGTKIGQPYNALVLREDLARLGEIMRQVGFKTEPMGENTIRILFTVEEFPRLRKMEVHGNNKVSAERIDKLAKLKPGDALDGRTIKSLHNALEQEYRAAGMPQAQIAINLVTLPAAGPEDKLPEADLQVVIQEGEQIRIEDMIIEGNEAFTALRLKTRLQTKGSWLFIKNFYDDRAFEDDLVDLRNFYNQHGYFDAVVERGTFREGTKGGKKFLSPVIRITEGKTYTLRSVDVRGARLFSRKEILDPFTPLLGKEYSGEKVMKAIEEARNLYFDGGFLTTEIKPDFKYDAQNRAADLTLQVTEQDRIYVGKIKIQRPKYEDEENPGVFRRYYQKIAPPISDEAILREVLLEPGQVYSKEREKETLRRLDRLGIFSDNEGKPAIHISNQPTANPREQDVLIDLQEGVTGNFGGGVGFGDVAGLFGFLWVNERNLFGEARDLRAQIQIGTGMSGASVTYLDRHFHDTADSLSVSIFYNTYRRSGYTETAAGINGEVTRPMYGDWDASVRGRLEMVSLKEASGTNADEDLNVSYPVVTGRLAFRQDTRYPYRNPTEGRMLMGGVEAGVADGPLLKFTGEADYYYELRKNLVYRLNPSFGLIPYNAESVGLTERLFLGGANDLRGFAVRGAGRRDPGDSDVGIGGAAKLLVRNEFLFPIYDPVSGVYFVDAGMLGKSPFSYEMPRLSTGLGGRLNIRYATIAVDFALPLLKGAGDQTQFLHFTFKSSL